MRSTKPTPTAKTMSAGRIPSVISARIDSALMATGPPFPKMASATGGRFTLRATIEPSSAAWSGVKPGLSRAIAPKTQIDWLLGSAEPCGMRIAVKRRPSRWGKWKPSGVTPTMVCGLPSRVRARPITAGSVPKRSFHRPAPITTTSGAPSRPSSSIKRRPSAGRTPRSLNAEGVIEVPAIFTGSAPVVSVKRSTLKPATPSMDLGSFHALYVKLVKSGPGTPALAPGWNSESRIN